MFNIGDLVKIKQDRPFYQFYPDTYIIEAINPETGAYVILGGIDFDESHLEFA